MAIRSNRKTAALISVGGAVAALAGASVGLFVGQPTFLALAALAVLVTATRLPGLLRTLTLNIEGSDVVYGSGGRAQRIPRSEVVVCAMTPGAWSFNGSSGVQLFALPAQRFDVEDVVAFCAEARIPTSGVPDQMSRRRTALNQARTMRGVSWFCLAALVALIGFFIWTAVTAQQDLDGYRTAPACAGSVPAAGCRFAGKAEVTAVTPEKSYSFVHVRLAGNGAVYAADVDFPPPSVQDSVDVEVWNGNLTLIDARPTVLNPGLNPNVNGRSTGAIAGFGVFGLVCLALLVFSQFQVRSARAGLRLAAGTATGIAAPVAPLREAAQPAGLSLPPCGIQHWPKEQFFAHLDPKQELNGAVVVGVIVAVPVGVFVYLAIAFSTIWWAGPAALGILFYAEQMVELWRGNRDGGIYADDLHVTKIETIFLWFMRRKTYDRKSILEVRLANGTMTIVGVDGSTLFSTALVSEADQQRFADFVGGLVVNEIPPPQPDVLAVPPTPTPAGVLPLPYRRAAGLLQVVGGLLLGLGAVNAAIRLPSSPADKRMLILILAGVLMVYGAFCFGAGLMLARGLTGSRELALHGGGIATAGALVALWLFTGNPAAVAIFAVAFVPVCALVVYWLRQPLPKRNAVR